MLKFQLQEIAYHGTLTKAQLKTLLQSISLPMIKWMIFMNTNAIAEEGIEHDYQRQSLEEKGCDIYQGYLFSKALPKDEYISSHVI